MTEPTYNVRDNIDQIRAVANGGQAWEAGLEELAKLFDSFAYNAERGPAYRIWHEASAYLRGYVDASRLVPGDFPPEGWDYPNDEETAAIDADRWGL
jgi:hypothetical protein